MISTAPSLKQLKQFGWLLALGFPFLIGWLLPVLFAHPFRWWTLWIAIPALILTLTAPGLLRLPYRAWMALGHALGWINSHVILGLVFIFVLQPIAFLMKLFGHDPLRKRKLAGHLSYRETKTPTPVDFNRIF